MGRRSADALNRNLREQAAVALAAVGGGVPSLKASQGDLEVELDGHRVTLDVKTMGYATVEALKR